MNQEGSIYIAGMSWQSYEYRHFEKRSTYTLLIYNSAMDINAPSRFGGSFCIAVGIMCVGPSCVVSLYIYCNSSFHLFSYKLPISSHIF